MSHCGFEDTVMNHLNLIKDVKEMNLSGISIHEICRKMEKRELDRRYFTVQAIANSEFLVLSMSDLDIVKRDFISQMTDFIQKNI